MFKSYYEVREWLENFIPLVYGKEELGLARIENLLKLLGNPERKFKSIHVAGTSGKGSTAYYAARLLEIVGPVSSFLPTSARSDQNSNRDKSDNPELRAGGNPSRTATRNFKVGLHISPHLVDIRERMQIFSSYRHPELVSGSRLPDHDPVSESSNETGSLMMPMRRFLRLFEQTRLVVEKIQKDNPDLTPSYFEILVAAAFKYFAEEKVDWAVVEVGLGGRLDATNVLMPEVSVITNIGLDHTEILGDTMEKIAFEKAGIIKRRVSRVIRVPRVSRDKGVPVITGATGGALRVIERVAKEKGAGVVVVSGSKYLVSGNEKKQNNTQSLNLELAEKAVEIALSLRTERSNLRSVILGSETTPESKHRSFPFGKLRGRMTTEDIGGLPGRFEEIEPRVIIDGAHNPDKMRFLIDRIKSIVNGQLSIVLVVAFKQGKDWKKMIDLLLKEFSTLNSQFSIQSVIATEFQAVTDTGKGSAVDPKEIAEYLNVKCQMSNVKCIENSQEATFEAIQATSNQQPVTILITGSLYLVGEVRTMWYLPTF